MENNNLEIVKMFLNALSEGKAGEELREFYDSNVIQIEFPNLLTKQTAERNINDLIDASIKGKKVLISQKYDLIKSYNIDNTVIIEAIWTGKIAIPLGKLSVGEEMKAYFAQIFEFENGKIIRQRNYDCFENFL